MKFKANTRRRALEYEKAIVAQWKENKTFEKSIEQRPKSNSYVFYDGPRSFQACHITEHS